MSRNLIRLNPAIGDDALEPTESVPPDGVISGAPNTRGLDWFVSDDGRASAGVWACDTYREHIPAFPYDELVFVVEGSVAITEPYGQPQTFGPGEVFVIRAGTECDFAVSGPFRKVYMSCEAGVLPSGGQRTDPPVDR